MAEATRTQFAGEASIEVAAEMMTQIVIDGHEGLAPDASTSEHLGADDRRRETLHCVVVDAMAPKTIAEALIWLGEDFDQRGYFLTMAASEASDLRKLGRDKYTKWADETVLRAGELHWFCACEAAWPRVQQMLREHRAPLLRARAQEQGTSIAAMMLPG